MSIKISYVIPHFNGIDLLRGCLHALKRQTYRPASQEVIVVDDCSQDDSGDWLRAHHPEVRLEKNEENLGFARAVNRGLKMARGDWIVLVNNDVQLAPGSIQAASRWFADQNKGSVAFNILNLRAPDRFDSAGDLFTTAGYAQKRYEGLLVNRNPALAGPVFSACGAAAAYRAAALREVGYFDESLEAYYEDVDLGIRLRLAGYECIFEPEARAFHRCGGTYGTRNLAAKSIFLNSRNAEKVFFKFFPEVFGFSHFIRHLVVLSIFLVAKIPAGRHWWYFLQGKMAALRWALTAPSGRWQGHERPAHKDMVLGALESRWLGAHLPTWRQKARRFFRQR
jgi:GT2 family glycosyltransferase